MRKAFCDIFISKTSKFNAFRFYLLYFGVFRNVNESVSASVSASAAMARPRFAL